MNDAAHVWSVFVGEEYGPGLRVALQMIAMIPIENLAKAINDINRAESIGPMIDPTAWIGGRKFRNADEYKLVLSAVISLRRLLPDIQVSQP